MSVVARLARNVSPASLAVALDDVSRTSSPPAHVVATPVATAISRRCDENAWPSRGCGRARHADRLYEFRGTPDRAIDRSPPRAGGQKCARRAPIRDCAAVAAGGTGTRRHGNRWWCAARAVDDTSSGAARLAAIRRRREARHGGQLAGDCGRGRSPRRPVRGSVRCCRPSGGTTERARALRRGATPPPRELAHAPGLSSPARSRSRSCCSRRVTLLGGSLLRLLRSTPGSTLAGSCHCRSRCRRRATTPNECVSFYSRFRAPWKSASDPARVAIVNEIPLDGRRRTQSRAGAAGRCRTRGRGPRSRAGLLRRDANTRRGGPVLRPARQCVGAATRRDQCVVG